MKKVLVLAILALCSISLFAQELIIFRDHRSLQVKSHREDKDWTYLTIGSGEMAVRTADILKIVKENVTAAPVPTPVREEVPHAQTPPPPHPTPTPSMQRPHPAVPSMYPTFKRPPHSLQPPPAEQKEQLKNNEDTDEEDMDESNDDEEAEPPQKAPSSLSPVHRSPTVQPGTSPSARGR